MKILEKIIAFTLIISLVFCMRVLAGPVPDTGQTQSYTATFGEDSDYTINPHSYTDLGVMVKDNVTGLIWQKATAGPMKWDEAINYFKGLSLGGYTDWRLPTIKELSFIVDSGRYDPAINTDYFPNTMSFYYWSSTASAHNTVVAWLVGFLNGDVGGSNKLSRCYVRAVRGGQ